MICSDYVRRRTQELLDELQESCTEAVEILLADPDVWGHRWRRSMRIGFRVKGAKILDQVEALWDETETLAREFDAANKRADDLAAQLALVGCVTNDGLLLGSFDPRGAFVYLLWGEDRETPLYVGMSVNILGRLGNHLGDRKKAPHVQSVSLVPCADRAEALIREAALIRLHQPPWNQAGIARRVA